MRNLFSILLLFASFAGYAQMNTFGGVGFRVNDTTTYQTNASAYHTAGYRDIYFNNQATTKHFDIWNGSSYTHAFNLGSASGSGGHVIEDEGTPLTQRTNMNFTGAGVSVADTGGKTVVTISGSAVTPAALTKTDDTNVTLTLGGTPSTALLQAASITAGWTGTLSGTRGGTGVNNGSNTITLAGNLVTSGANSLTLTTTGTTNVTLPTTGTVSTVAGTETLTNKRINPRVQAVTSSATVTPNADTDDAVKITAQAAGLTLANPSGTPAAMQAMVIRLKDNGTSRSITYGSQYRAVGVILPTATTVSKTIYFGMVWNSDDSKWDVVGYSLEQ